MNRKGLAFPYLFWMIIFIIVPVFLVVWFSFTAQNTSNFTMENYKRFFQPIFISVLFDSLKLAFVSTVICLILGYPTAMILANSKLSQRTTLVLLMVIPMWMNFLLRTYAWMSLLAKNGVINNFLKMLHLPTINILYTDWAVILGMFYNFIPFMILPIYSVLIKIDRNLIDAAYDLGAGKTTAFLRVIFPLSLPGVVSGALMVFMPAVTTFVISNLLGGGQFTLIGNLIENQFLSVGNWNFGSSISMILMALIILSMLILSKYNKEKEGMGLW